MSITRGEFLRSLGKSLPGLVASTGAAATAEALLRRAGQAMRERETEALSPSVAEEPVPYLQRGPATRSSVALTFDDGPEPGTTERILDTLRTQGVSATFFLIGEKVAAVPALARRIVEEGHAVGHHTYTHRKLTGLAPADLEDELVRTSTLFQNILGRRAVWFRPPFGALRQDQARRVRDHGMAVVLWSLDSEDWRGGTGPVITERILSRAHPGAIILCHDKPATADGLDATLSRLREKAQEFVSLDAMAPAAVNASA